MAEKKKVLYIYPVIAVFDLVMVVPLFLEMFLGIPDIPRDVYMNFVRAMEDQTTLFIYCLFVLLAQLMFTYELKRIKKLDRRVTKTNDIQELLLFICNDGESSGYFARRFVGSPSLLPRTVWKKRWGFLGCC